MLQDSASSSRAGGARDTGPSAHASEQQAGRRQQGACVCWPVLQATRAGCEPSRSCSRVRAVHTCTGCCWDWKSDVSCTASAHTSCCYPAACLTYIPSFDYSCDRHGAAAKASQATTGSSACKDTSRFRTDQVRGTAGPWCLSAELCVAGSAATVCWKQPRATHKERQACAVAPCRSCAETSN
jgi:hypothetical protein